MDAKKTIATNSLKNNEEWFTIEELAKWSGFSVKTLKSGEKNIGAILKEMSINIDVNTRLGGYHNTQRFYSTNVLKALKEYQVKNSISSAVKDKVTVISGNISYLQNQTVKQTISNLMDTPETLQLLLAESLSRTNHLQIENKKLNEIIIEQQPKVEFYDDVTGSKDTIDMKEVAKILNIKNIGRNKLFEILRNKNILDRSNQPYQKYVDAGYFRVIESRFNLPDGEIKISLKTVVFQQGLDFIRRELGKTTA